MNYWMNLNTAAKVAESIVKKFGMTIFKSENSLFDAIDVWLTKHFPDYDLSDFSFKLMEDPNTHEIVIDSVVAL